MPKLYPRNQGGKSCCYTDLRDIGGTAMGHSDLRVTLRYTHLAAEDLL